MRTHWKGNFSNKTIIVITGSYVVCWATKAICLFCFYNKKVNPRSSKCLVAFAKKEDTVRKCAVEQGSNHTSVHSILISSRNRLIILSELSIDPLKISCIV